MLGWRVPCQRRLSSSEAQLTRAANKVCPSLVARGQRQPHICAQALALPFPHYWKALNLETKWSFEDNDQNPAFPNCQKKNFGLTFGFSGLLK